MEKSTPESHTKVSLLAQNAAANELGCALDDLQVVEVGGGYSRNRRSLVGYGDKWLFAKEVDKDLLPGDGAEELGWLRKDHEMASTLRERLPQLVSEWSRLSDEDHVLLMSSYREVDGWHWSLPSEEHQQHAYIQAVIDATKRLEPLEFDEATIERLNLHPFFRDELAYDGGLELIAKNETIRSQLEDKYSLLEQTTSPSWLYAAYDRIRELLRSPEELIELMECASSLKNQPNDCFNHCDVRSDNIAYNSSTNGIKFVDWNWASFAPAKFGSTEFLIDMARRGADVAPWADELNPELLAATIGLYATRCLRDPLSPQSTLRTMQAESAAVALGLYDLATKNR